MANIKEMIEEMKSQWNRPYVMRSEAYLASHGAYGWKSLRDHDRRGEGPSDYFRLGRRICYTRESFFAWLESKMSQT